MSADLICTAQPTAEPVSIADMLVELELANYTDTGLQAAFTAKMGGYITAARMMCEDYCRSSFMTQSWLLKLDGFPRANMRYSEGWERHAILLPKAPFQSIASVQYVDTTGALIALAQDTDHGNDPTPAYAYQLDPGSDTQPARVGPSWLRPWPPTRMVQSNVLIAFKSGFGGPVTASMVATSAVLTGPKFNPGDVGQAVTVAGAGVSAAKLVTTIASVGGAGVATLEDAAATDVAAEANNVWVGQQVPVRILQAIKFLAAFYYNNGAVVDMPTPRVVAGLLDRYRNLVS